MMQDNMTIAGSACCDSVAFAPRPAQAYMYACMHATLSTHHALIWASLRYRYPPKPFLTLSRT